MKKEYIVTLKRKEDLESFYNDMEILGVELKHKRVLSKNTHYLLTEDESQELKKDDRVLSVRLINSEIGVELTLLGSRQINRNFDKNPSNLSGFYADANELTIESNWGLLHCAGDVGQRRKGVWGSDDANDGNITDTVEIFNNGENVDIVIVDSAVANDHYEFLDPDTANNRFQEHQWYQLYGQIVTGSPISTTITYNTDNELHALSETHGTHVAGICAGIRQGWANKSNIYSIALQDISSTGQFNETTAGGNQWDYIRAFHMNKPINPITGKRNPTITNHSYIAVWDVIIPDLSSTSLPKIYFRGVTYNNQGLWTTDNLYKNFGLTLEPIYDENSNFLGYGNYNKFLFNQNYYYSDENTIPSDNGNMAELSDIQQTIDDGIIVVAAAGNSNFYGVPAGHQDFNNAIFINGSVDGTQRSSWIFYNRSGYPAAGAGFEYDKSVINVGNMSSLSDFSRSTSSCHGPIVSVFAPGESIMSSYPFSDPDDIIFQSSGTSMASPQVAGILACHFTNKDASEVNHNRAQTYIEQFGIYDDLPDPVTGEVIEPSPSLNGSKNITISAVDKRKVYTQYGLIIFNDTPRKNNNYGEVKTGMVYPRNRKGKVNY